jgi:plastocyanin
MSTTVGAVIVIVVILIIAGAYFALSAAPSTSTTANSSGNVSTTGATSSTGGASGSSTITIPQGAGTGLNFSPSSLTVSSGTTITWVDHDTSATHNVYFTSVPSGASTPSPNPSPNLNNGNTFSVTLTTPGTYHYECQYHSGWMQGTITVTS